MIPDKLYINKYMIRPGMLHPAEFPPDNPEWEYIRKDALLEWAKEHQEGERQGSYTWSCYQIFIDKLNEM